VTKHSGTNTAIIWALNDFSRAGNVVTKKIKKTGRVFIFGLSRLKIGDGK
jgi:hypothetical protein